MLEMDSFIVGQFSCMDLVLNYFGTDRKKSGEYTGPKVREFYLIHYIIRGKGIFQVGNRTYELGANQGFVIFPGQLTFYKADLQEPWEYCFIAFSGLNSEYYLRQANLSMDTPVFQYTKDQELPRLVSDMLHISKKARPSREPRLLSLLYGFIYCLIDAVPDCEISLHRGIDYKRKYIDGAVEHIKHNYSRKLLISEVASYVGLDISYLGQIFKKYVKVTPQQYLMNYRVEKACQFMGDQSLTIGDIARSVGYEDPLLFSKIFRKVKRMSPSEYRSKVTG